MTVSFNNCRRAIIGILAIAQLGSCMAFAGTDKCIVKTARRNDKATTVDVGPAVLQSDGSGGTYEIAGMHGWVLGCNNDQATCYMPHTGDSGYIEEPYKNEEIYDGENVKIQWPGRTVSIYVLKETY